MKNEKVNTVPGFGFQVRKVVFALGFKLTALGCICICLQPVACSLQHYFS
jgi:hypothetical protein